MSISIAMSLSSSLEESKRIDKNFQEKLLVKFSRKTIAILELQISQIHHHPRANQTSHNHVVSPWNWEDNWKDEADDREI
jgi:hypothetical protein